jgi:4-carboxymuconolactone decarboxylase
MAQQNAEPNRLALGRTTFEQALGTSADDFAASLDAIVPGFADMILETEFGNAYQRPGLDLKTRELVIVATCAVIGTAGFDAVKMHIPAALRAGATRTEIVEVLYQIAFSAGLPTAIGALQAAKSVFDTLDQQAA